MVWLAWGGVGCVVTGGALVLEVVCGMCSCASRGVLVTPRPAAFAMMRRSAVHAAVPPG